MKKLRLLLTIVLMCLSVVGCMNIGRNYKTVNIKNWGTTYQMIREYDGEFSYEIFSFENFDSDNDCSYINESEDIYVDRGSSEYGELTHGKIVDFKEYKSICEKYSFTQEFDDDNKNYIVIMYAPYHSGSKFVLVDVEVDDDVRIYYMESFYPVDGDGEGYFCVIPTDASTHNGVKCEECYTQERIEYLKSVYELQDYVPTTDDKPVIYLYTEDDFTEVNVSLELTDAELTCTYPAYKDGWSVLANKDGLINYKGKEYNYLYWEGRHFENYKITQGFCVKGSDTAEFLENKLAELGLNRKEANEFIVYWLPLMEQNDYNVISFDTREYENNYKLHVDPKPDTVIRVFMTWYGTDKEIDIMPQDIITPSREGFTVVEWGGSEIK